MSHIIEFRVARLDTLAPQLHEKYNRAAGVSALHPSGYGPETITRILERRRDSLAALAGISKNLALQRIAACEAPENYQPRYSSTMSCSRPYLRCVVSQ